MKQFISILILFVSLNVGAQPEINRAYLKLPTDKVVDSKLVKMNFGLTEKQKQEIFEVSQGEVDFKSLYYVDSKSLKAMGLERFVTSFGSTNFDPPGLITDADPKAQEGWWLEALNAPAAWDHATGKGITMADCDAGYHVEEPDLKDNLIMEFAKDLADIDNPYLVSDGPYAYHGTAVVAIMSGVLDGAGTNGIAYDSQVIPLQNFNYSASDDIDKEEATAQCILEALKVPETDIIVLENQTRGSSETFEGTREAVKLALKAGVVIVSAAGNSANDLTIEAQYDTGSIIVGAINRNGSKAGFSNYGSRVSIAAFGNDLYTLYGPNGKFGSFGGTSGATPQVAATVALMLEINPNLTPAEVKDILVETRETTPQNQKVGGQLDTLRAVQRTIKTKNPDQPVSQEKQEMRVLRKKLLEIL